MLSILRSGGMLALADGNRLPNSSKCCCDNPPGECYCPGFCSYVLSQTSPSGFAHSATQDCDSTEFYSAISDALEAAIIPPPDGYEACDFGGRAVSSLENYPGDSANAPYLFGNFEVFRNFARPNECDLREYVAVSFRAYISVRCYQADGYKVTVGWTVTGYSEAGGIFLNSLFGAGAGCTTALSSTCLKLGSRHCSPQPYQHAHKWLDATPLDIPVSWSNVSSCNDAFDVTDYVADPDFASYLESLKTTLNASFRISSRPSCQALDCICPANLVGLQVDFDGHTYTLGEVSDVYDDLAGDGWKYRYSSGGSSSSFYITHESLDTTLTKLLSRKRIDVYCQSTANGIVWFALFTTLCNTFDAFGQPYGSTTDTWMGKVLCYRACEDLENDRDAGDSIPLGEAVEIEFLGREVYFDECTPPARPAFKIRQLATC